MTGLIAGEKYAAYLCDECEQSIGVDGTVQLTTLTPVLVWEARCPEHRKVVPAPDYNPRIDYPERYSDGPY